MPQKTIYVRNQDQDVFLEAEEMLEKKILKEESLSSIIASSLRIYLIMEKEKLKHMREVRLAVNDEHGASPRKYIQFFGRCLAEYALTEGELKREYRIYHSSRGKFLLHITDRNEARGNSSSRHIIHSSLDEMKDVPAGLLLRARAEMESKQVVFLDI